ncbi:uncharacterized protein M6B38_386555 [Iris pallida]|uniref:Uncharacterized protein n=1 Tax=Iris pallida TaxID=29817 RepID=A0AAX6G3B5_IRIPA|nr:uncharacterized protein M6B38_386555 [Iris pallida]
METSSKPRADEPSAGSCFPHIPTSSSAPGSTPPCRASPALGLPSAARVRVAVAG